MDTIKMINQLYGTKKDVKETDSMDWLVVRIYNQYETNVEFFFTQEEALENMQEQYGEEIFIAKRVKTKLVIETDSE